MKKYYEEKRIRPDVLTAAVYCSIIILMLYEVVAIRIYGEKGAGYSAGSLAIFFAFYCSFVLAVQKAVWVMVRVRARKSQYKNAEENMKKTLKIFAFTGVLVTVVFTFIGINFSDLLLDLLKYMQENNNIITAYYIEKTLLMFFSAPQ